MDSFVSCPFCHLSISQSEIQRHANSHFEEEEKESAQGFALESSSSSPSSTPSDEKVSCLVALQVRSSFYHVKVDCGGGLMGLLRKRLESDCDSFTSSRVLLSGYVDHYQSIPSEDSGWGCGWRNIQMLSSFLLYHREDVKQLLFGGSCFVPEIAYLQRWLEIAWDRGFDALGAHHFNHSVYGSKSWIGATECAALFRSFGLRARIVDFGPKEMESLFLSVPGAQIGSANAKLKRKALKVYGPMDRYLLGRHHDSQDVGSVVNHLHGGSNQIKFSSKGGHQVLLDWVWNYFSEGCSTSSAHHHHIIVTDRAPLYFQHDGHSRTIVGIEARHQQNGKLQYNLLILDPGHRTAALEKSLKENLGWKKLIKRGVHTLRKPQYQLCYIDSGVARGEEIEKLKIMDSDFIEL
ncbi:hypothetical protein JCGZ_00540 [Jatropha curcas]|uniref:UFSP1/2/DUB catalytic domain-containing protein n=1 Tax=Jatropha curcas TaxID=180498 RepID=A0A067JJU1_JATCU|nr:zinc finger-containing ubiquitin peptidase 1 [Jatropha curcas]KDP23113.1 hypothetical protein JCGZ_00540 [Jatropha curcas]